MNPKVNEHTRQEVLNLSTAGLSAVEIKQRTGLFLTEVRSILKEENKPHRRKCKQCGNWFIPTDVSVFYCSSKCTQQAQDAQIVNSYLNDLDLSITDIAAKFRITRQGLYKILRRNNVPVKQRKPVRQPKPLVKLRCPECGKYTVLESGQERRKYCSIECSKLAKKIKSEVLNVKQKNDAYTAFLTGSSYKQLCQKYKVTRNTLRKAFLELGYEPRKTPRLPRSHKPKSIGFI